MKKTSDCEYQKIIRHGAWDKFSQKHGTKDIIISSVVAVVIGIGWWFVFKRGDDSLLIALATLGIFFLVYCAIYLCYFRKEHVNLYNDEQERINQLEETWTGPQIELLLPVRTVNFPEVWAIGLPKFATISVQNPSKRQTITDLSVEWTKITWVQRNGQEIDQTLSFQAFSGKPNMVFKSGITILPGSEERIDIARIKSEDQEEKMVLLLKNEVVIDSATYDVITQEDLITGNPHQTRKKLCLMLDLVIKGYMDNRQIKPRQFRMYVTFQTITSHAYFENGWKESTDEIKTRESWFSTTDGS
jgi:hypothetical protein